MIVFFLIITIDQVLKVLITLGRIPLEVINHRSNIVYPHPLLGHFFAIVLPLITVLLVIITIIKNKKMPRVQRISTYAISGGLTTNIIDKVFRSEVIYYKEIPQFTFIPPLNIGNTVVAIGALIMLISMIILDRDKSR